MRPVPRSLAKGILRVSAGTQLALAMLTPVGAHAALELPRRSPPGHVFAHVGLTDITVEYDSPAARGREIWGEVVSYGRPWRGSESPAARLAVGKEITFGEAVVEPGLYALVLIPGVNLWTVALSRDVTNLRGGGVHLASQEVARVQIPAHMAPHRERLTFSFSDATHEAVTLDFDWAGVRLSIPLALHTRDQLEAGLRELEALPASYANVARYMLEVKRDYGAGLQYIEKALILEHTWQNLLLKSALLAARGDKREARAVNAEAFEMRRRSGDEPLPGPERSKLASPMMLASTSRLAANARGGGSASRLTRTVLIQQARAPIAIPHEELAQEPALPLPLPLPLPPPLLAPLPATLPPRDELDERAAPTLPVVEPRNGNPLGPVEIGRILEKGKRDLQSCYQQALRKDPSFTRANVSTSVTIGLSGRARTIVLESPSGLGSLEPCLKEMIGRWAFPVSGSEYDVQFPLSLRGHD